MRTICSRTRTCFGRRSAYSCSPTIARNLPTSPGCLTPRTLPFGHSAGTATSSAWPCWPVKGKLPEDVREHMYDGGRVKGNMLPDVLTTQLRDYRGGDSRRDANHAYRHPPRRALVGIGVPSPRRNSPGVLPPRLARDGIRRDTANCFASGGTTVIERYNSRPRATTPAGSIPRSCSTRFRRRRYDLYDRHADRFVGSNRLGTFGRARRHGPGRGTRIAPGDGRRGFPRRSPIGSGDSSPPAPTVRDSSTTVPPRSGSWS